MVLGQLLAKSTVTVRYETNNMIASIQRNATSRKMARAGDIIVLQELEYGDKAMLSLNPMTCYSAAPP